MVQVLVVFSQESSNGPILRDKTGGELPVDAHAIAFELEFFPQGLKIIGMFDK